MSQRLYTTRWEIERGDPSEWGDGRNPWLLYASPAVSGRHRIGAFRNLREAIGTAKSKAGPYDSIVQITVIAPPRGD